MSAWLTAFGLLAGFLVLARTFGLTERSQKVLVTTRHSMEVMRASSMSDSLNRRFDCGLITYRHQMSDLNHF